MQVQIMTWRLSVERVKPSSADLIEKYNAVAHQWQQKVQRFGYDRAYASLFAQLHDKLDRHFVRQSANTVLDCGVGTGALSAALYKSGHANLTLHGVDTSSVMANAARKHLAQLGVSGLIRTEDVRCLSDEDNVFSMVMSAHTIEHLPKPVKGIQEMTRVLRPGAPLLIVTTRPSLPGSLIDAQWGLTCLGETELAEAFMNAGLCDVQFVPLGGPVWCRYLSYALIGWKGESF